MDRTGHTTLQYEQQETEKVSRAKQTYDQKVEEGYAPFEQLEDGTYIRTQREFDAQADYLMRPPVQGG